MHIEAINDESYRMIMEQTDEIIFEYDTWIKPIFIRQTSARTSAMNRQKRVFSAPRI